MLKDVKIKCPKCGYEYLPAEIFFQEDILGKPKNIIRDAAGKILFYTGEEPSGEQEWTCYQCNAILKVNANLSVSAEENIEHNFDEDYKSPLYPNKLKLEELNLFDD